MRTPHNRAIFLAISGFAIADVAPVLLEDAAIEKIQNECRIPVPCARIEIQVILVRFYRSVLRQRAAAITAVTPSIAEEFV